MKLRFFLLEGKEGPIVYLDMDGVLTDFEAAFKKIDGRTTKELEKEGDPVFWDHVKKGGLKFWSQMPWMKGGKELWNHLKGSNVEILSAPARALPECPEGKRVWVKRELGNVKLNLKRASEKHEFASPISILIDDNEDNVKKWNSAGGQGIHHTSLNNTLKQLRKYGL